MTMKKLKRKSSFRADVDTNINFWHQFPFEWWWRKRYDVPFGSEQHRSMSLIDMYFEYVETLRMNKIEKTVDEEEIELTESGEEVVNMTQGEIDKEFEELDLSQFDKQ